MSSPANEASTTTLAKPQVGLTGLARVVCIALAGVCLALGLIGLVVPLLPTTPFVLLASFLLVRTSPRLHRRLQQAAIVGPILRDWQQHHGVRRGVRLRATVAMLIIMGIAAWLLQPPPVALAIMTVGTAVGIAIIARLPVIR